MLLADFDVFVSVFGGCATHDKDDFERSIDWKMIEQGKMDGACRRSEKSVEARLLSVQFSCILIL